MAGFLLLLFLAMAAFFSIIHFATRLTPPDTGVSQSAKKLTLVGSMLSKLIDADGQARAYITTGQRRYLTQYQKDEQSIRAIADSLKRTSLDHTEQYLRMLVVDSLLDLKKNTLESYFRLNKAKNMPILSPERLDQMLQSFTDTVEIPTTTITKHETVKTEKPRETAAPKKEGFFRRIWSGIGGKSQPPDSTHTVETVLQKKPDTVQTIKKIHDTTIAQMRSQLEQMSEEERLVRQMTAERELMLLRTDQIILDEIRNVLILYEKEEINRAIEGAESAGALVRRLWNTAIIMAMAGMATMLIFILLIWKDLARSAFYRRQLEKARLLAERLLKVKELFLANMGHEIRTPITSIIGFSERLANTQLSNEQQDYLSYINSSSDHLLGLIDDLLDYSRIGSGKINLEPEPFIPEFLAKEVYETLKPNAEKKGLGMTLKLSGETGKAASGDQLRIRQIIYNLLNNSIKFTERGEVILQLSAASADDTLELHITVSDTGIGIPEEKQQEIFEEFTQVDEGITRKYGGSGLGLAICRKLTMMMGGTISLKSTEGEGTTVEITLPLPEYSGEVKTGAGTRKSGVPVLAGKRVLIAEDDDTTRLLIVGLLRDTGAETDVVNNGRDALQRFVSGQNNYDLIITDIQMPVMSGPDLTAAIIGHAGKQGIAAPPVIGLTAYATREDLNNYRNTGMSQILIKPFRQSELYAMVAGVLNCELTELPAEAKTDETRNSKLSIDAFAEFTGNDPEILKKILESLVNDVKTTVPAMQEALGNRDYRQIAELSHRIRPNIKNLGAPESSLLQKLEAMCKTDTPDHTAVAGMVEKACSSLTETEKELMEIIRRY